MSLSQEPIKLQEDHLRSEESTPDSTLLTSKDNMEAIEVPTPMSEIVLTNLLILQHNHNPNSKDPQGLELLADLVMLVELIHSSMSSQELHPLLIELEKLILTSTLTWNSSTKTEDLLSSKLLNLNLG